MLARPTRTDPGASTDDAREPAGSAGAGRAPRIAVIVPIYEEAAIAPALARRLAGLGAHPGRPEIIVVDGGSRDGGPATLARLAPGALLVTAPRGRARQMNAGARRARAEVLLFLHADTALEDAHLDAALGAIGRGAGFGCFRVRIASRDPRLGLAARLINLRSRLLPSATGDQAIFVRRDLFEAVGGFPEVEICEDLALVRRLAARARFAPLGRAVVTSARRWERTGVARTIALMWLVRAGWHLGVAPARLARWYRDVR